MEGSLKEEQGKTKSETKVKTGRCVKGSWIQEYLKYTAGQESPELFHLWSAVTVLAGVVRRNIWMQYVGKLYPNFYVVLVAPTGVCRKGEPLRQGSQMLRQIDDMKILHEKATSEGIIKYMKLDSLKKKNMPGGKFEIVEECTTFILASELANFIGSTSYSEQLAEFMTGLWDNHDHWDYTTRGRGKEELTNININFLGATNPEWLAKGFGEDSFGGGFIGRIIFIYQNERVTIAWPKKTKAQLILKDLLVLDLQHIAQIQGEMKVTKNAYDFFEEWYNSFKPDMSGRMVGYLQRKHVHMLKLAILISIAENDEMLVREEHIRAAKMLLDQIEELMPEAFAYVGATNEARIAQHILEMIKDNKGIIPEMKLLAGIRRMIKNKREFDGVIEILVESGIISVGSRDKRRYYFFTDAHLAKMKKMKEKKGQ